MALLSPISSNAEALGKGTFLSTAGAHLITWQIQREPLVRVYKSRKGKRKETLSWLSLTPIQRTVLESIRIAPPSLGTHGQTNVHCGISQITLATAIEAVVS